MADSTRNKRRTTATCQDDVDDVNLIEAEFTACRKRSEREAFVDKETEDTLPTKRLKLSETSRGILQTHISKLADLEKDELDLLCLVCYLRSTLLPQRLLECLCGSDLLDRLIAKGLLQKQPSKTVLVLDSELQENIKKILTNNNEEDHLVEVVKVLSQEIESRKEGDFPYPGYIKDILQTGMEAWDNVFLRQSALGRLVEELSVFATATSDETNSPGLSVLFCSKANRNLCRHFGQMDSNSLTFKICMASIHAKNGKSMIALKDLEEYSQVALISSDPKVRRLLYKIYLTKAKILKNDEKYDDAIEVCDTVLKLDTDKFLISNKDLSEIKIFQSTLYNLMGDGAEALNICDDVVQETSHDTQLKSVHLDAKLTLAGILVGMEKNDQALEQVLEVVKSRTEMYGANHSSVLQAKTVHADILEEMGQQDQSLSELQLILGTVEKKFGADHVHTLQPKSNISRVLASKGQINEATLLLNNMLETITKKYTNKSKEYADFIEFKSNVLTPKAVATKIKGPSRALVTTSAAEPGKKLPFKDVLQVYGEVKRFYLSKYLLSISDTPEVIERVVLHNYHSGDWVNALKDAEWIYERICEELGDRHIGLEQPLGIMSSVFSRTNDPHKQLEVTEKLYRVRLLNYGESCADTINALTNVAVLREGLGMHAGALVSYECVYKILVHLNGPTHEKTLKILYTLGKLQFKCLLYNEALETLQKVEAQIEQVYQESGERERMKFKVMHKIVLCHLRLANIEEAQKLSKDLYDDSCWTFGTENMEYQQLKEFCQDLYERRKKSSRRWTSFFPNVFSRRV